MVIERSILGDCTMVEADAWKLFLVSDLITFLREGVRTLNEQELPEYGTTTCINELTYTFIITLHSYLQFW